MFKILQKSYKMFENCWYLRSVAECGGYIRLCLSSSLPQLQYLPSLPAGNIKLLNSVTRLNSVTSYNILLHNIPKHISTS